MPRSSKNHYRKGRFIKRYQLSDEILLNILRHLNVRDRMLSATVCRQWHRVAVLGGWAHFDTLDFATLENLVADGSMRRRRDYGDGWQLHNAASAFTKSVFRLLCRAGPNLLHLDLQNMQFDCGFTKILIVDSGVCWNKLTHLKLSNLRNCYAHRGQRDCCSCVAAIIRHVLHNLGAQLLELHMDNCCLYDRYVANFDRKEIGDAFSGLEKLQTLSLRRGAYLTGIPSFRSLPATLRRLDITDTCVDLALADVADRCADLKQLIMCGSSGRCKTDSSQVIESLQRLKKLRILDVSWWEFRLLAPFITPAFLSGALSQLRELYIQVSQYNMTEQFLEMVVDSCPMLETLNVARSRITGGCLSRLSQLSRLCISDTNVDDASLRSIAQNGRLKALCVAHTAFNWQDTTGISDDALAHVANDCPDLYILDLQGRSTFSDTLAEALLSLVQLEGRTRALTLWVGATTQTTADSETPLEIRLPQPPTSITASPNIVCKYHAKPEDISCHNSWSSCLFGEKLA